MSLFDNAEVISTYTLEQAIEDELLVEIFKNRWQELSGGKPIVATAHLCNEVSLAGLMASGMNLSTGKNISCRHSRKRSSSFT